MPSRSTLILSGVGLVLVLLAGFAIKYLIDQYGISRETAGMQKILTARAETENDWLRAGLRDTLLEVQSSQAMMREFASIDDKTIAGPTGRALLDKLQHNEPPIPARRPASP